MNIFKNNTLVKKYNDMPVQIRASMWFLFCSFMQKGILMITTPIFTRLLTTAEYGKFSVFNTWLGIISIFVTLNLSFGVYSQGLVKFSDERPVFISSLQGLTCSLVLLWAFIYFLFSSFWNRLLGLSTYEMLLMLLLIWLAAVFNFWADAQRVIYNYRPLVALTILVSIIRPSLGVFLVLHSANKVDARITGMAIVDLIAYFGLFIFHMSKGKVFFSKKFWKYAVLFNLPLIPHYLSQTVLNGADRIMIERMVGEGEAGIYSLAYSVSMIMTIFNTALSQTISPWIYTKIKENKISEISHKSYIALIIVATMNLLLICLAPEVISIFAPSEYYEAIWVIPPVCLSVFFMFSYDLFAKFEFYYEKSQYIMFASIITALMNIILNYVFIHALGYVAAGYTTLFCYILNAFGHYIMMNKVCKEFCNNAKPYNQKLILLISSIFLLIGFLLMATYNFAVIRYGIVFLLIMTLFFLRKRIIQILKTLTK